MSEKWEITGPRVLDIGDDGERVRKFAVGLVGGHIDVVTHDDSPTARVEVHEVVGRPLKVTWNGSKLKISQVKDDGDSLWDTIKQVTGNRRDAARISVSIPEDATASVSTVSATSVISGTRATTRANTVSGDMTVDDIEGTIDLNAVSGSIEAHALSGTLRANAVSGEITVHRSRLDPIKLNTVSGDVTLDLLGGRSVISSSSVSGDVTLRIPQGGGYSVQVHSISGHAIVDGMELGGKPGARGGQVEDGDGALKVTANSVSGDVVILRAVAPDLQKAES
ncbi:DUF4097 family beta strand repeat-containing protein [Leekyejoonella antrihumi]|nr:DUF4097 family beta strand repeat-containing protein [Leekyejoonella antrihumi]